MKFSVVESQSRKECFSIKGPRVRVKGWAIEKICGFFEIPAACFYVYPWEEVEQRC